MKRSFLLALSVLSVFAVTAAPRSLQEAQQAAAQYFTSHSNVLRAPQHGNAMKHVWTAMQPDGEPAFFVFNRGENDGFILISAEDGTRTVLGYSDNGHFAEDELSEGARAWLDEYRFAIHHVAKSSASTEPLPVPQSPAKTYTPVAPICKTLWDQGDPYNLLCPKKNGVLTQTGCVATAAAQIMKVYNHPAQGTGSHSYYWKRGTDDEVQLSVDFSTATYQWNLMKNSYKGTATQDSKNAVATLMYHCGVACNMAYGLRSAGGSWAYFDDMMYGLINYFGYDKGIRTIAKDYMGEELFLDSVYADLKAGYPVYFFARTVKDEGHAFVCDGMDANGLVHINWGWGGSSDAYYPVSVMDPENQGAGGSVGNNAYVIRVCAYTHIRPNKNEAARHTFTCGPMRVENERFARDELPSISLDTLQNYSLYRWSGKRALMLYKDGRFFGVYNHDAAGNLDPYYYYYYFRIRPSLQSVPEGDYTVIPVITDDDRPGVYEPVYSRGNGLCRCPMRVTADSIFMGKNAVPDPQGIEEVFENANPQVLKVLKEGRLFIEKNGHIYDAEGRKVTTTGK